jgi:hypothetical protein
MIEIAHSIPGRLRIVVKQRHAAAEIAAAARQFAGVTEAMLNPVTGSLVLIYDPAARTATELWTDLLACAGTAMPAGSALPTTRDSAAWFDPIVASAVDACLRYVVKRSTARLLAAVI